MFTFQQYICVINYQYDKKLNQNKLADSLIQYSSNEIQTDKNAKILKFQATWLELQLVHK